ncbi:MAG: hypothetical protein WB987_09825 [Candidatus Acidiferrales bacterium]
MKTASRDEDAGHARGFWTCADLMALANALFILIHGLVHRRS